ncbi:hypothetical protein BDN71DRAFT_1434296 [Pleurotus eryngii]|uniref:Heterokaryon incompatibility domain-containing protein n=1 Tax=Pleurotus eryngii TaxID=5323 RepID=A0A9P5ZRE0_PLEER|nr:hypothetical protein BDN71DRAFT_1434296 [Pleurotus eryngii]
MESIIAGYDEYISSYVAKCPFYLFDTRKERNVSRSELKGNILTSLMNWTKAPLTCAEAVDTILDAVDSATPLPKRWRWFSGHDSYEDLPEDEGLFLLALGFELRAHSQMYRMSAKKDNALRPPLPMDSIILAVCKRGFLKLAEFSRVIKTHYGCRYLWMDSACDSPNVQSDRWSTRGWALQDRIKCFTVDWNPSRDVDLQKILATRGNPMMSSSTLAENTRCTMNDPRPPCTRAPTRRRRQTTVPEDRVYSLLSALNVNMPAEYGEGLDRAFYRLQAKILTLTKDRRFLLWQSSSWLPGILRHSTPK